MNHAPEITPVREAHRFNEKKLTDYLQSNMPAFSGPLQIQQFEGGQSNPTFVLSNGSNQFVLRKKPPGPILPSAHQVDREFTIMKALETTDVLVPKMLLLCQDSSIIGTEFYIMEMVEGRVITDISQPGFTPQERTAICQHLMEILAALHKVDYQSLGLEEFGRPGNYITRQISRWSKQYISSQTDELESMEKIMKWLPENMPPEEDPVIVHGDYRLGNVIIHPTEPRIVAILDWELSTLGNPLGDLAYNSMSYYIYENDFKTFEKLGIPSEQQNLDYYCTLTGRDRIDNWEFYLAFNFFRYAAIIQGVYKRGLDGNASSDQALSKRDAAKSAADHAWEIVQQMS